MELSANYVSHIGFFNKAKIILALLFNKWNYKIKLDNGNEIDLKNNTIIFNNLTRFHFKETFHLSSDKHILISSGKKPEEREGYNYSIWENSDLDEYGRPIRYHMYINNITGNNELLPIIVKNNKIIAPEGYSLLEDKKIKSYPRRKRK